VTKLNSLLFSECTNLTNVNGFEKIDSILIFGGFHGYFGFVSNTSLSSLEGIRNVKYVEGTIDVFNNTQLEECCVISHLVKNPHDNQYITFERNGGLCNHSYLLDSCNINTQFSCEDINLTTEDELSITNITAPITILKVFDANYTTVYDCYADCEDSINIPDLATGTYHININFYNENWQSICEYNKTIEIEDTTQSRNSKFSPSDFALFPNPAKAETFIDLSKIKGDAITLNLYNQLGQQVWTKDIDEVKLNRERIDLADFQNGLYFLKIQTKSRKLIVKKLMISRLY
jgi:hypothetical protein